MAEKTIKVVSAPIPTIRLSFVRQINRVYSFLNCYRENSATNTILERLEKDVLDRFPEQEDRIKDMNKIFKEKIALSSSLVNLRRTSTKKHELIQETLTCFR